MIGHDDRITCEQCFLLDSRGYCKSKVITKSFTYRPFLDLKKRCPGFMPNSQQTDRRTADERWPAILGEIK